MPYLPLCLRVCQTERIGGSASRGGIVDQTEGMFVNDCSVLPTTNNWRKVGFTRQGRNHPPACLPACL